MRLTKAWQDGVTLLAGIWFAMSPWAFGYGMGDDRMLYNSLAVGLALVLFSAGALARPQAWEEVVDFLIGLWAIASPWVVGFNNLRDMTANAVIIGLVVVVMAAWAAVQRTPALMNRFGHHGPI